MSESACTTPKRFETLATATIAALSGAGWGAAFTRPAGNNGARRPACPVFRSAPAELVLVLVEVFRLDQLRLAKRLLRQFLAVGDGVMQQLDRDGAVLGGVQPHRAAESARLPRAEGIAGAAAVDSDAEARFRRIAG